MLEHIVYFLKFVPVKALYVQESCESADMNWMHSHPFGNQKHPINQKLSVCLSSTFSISSGTVDTPSLRGRIQAQPDPEQVRARLYSVIFSIRNLTVIPAWVI